MSGDGDCGQRKQGEDLQEMNEEEEDEVDSQPIRQEPRPMTARRASRQRRSTPSSSESLGAVGGEGAYTRHLNEQERRVGGQAQMLLEMFIMDRMGRDAVPTRQRKVVEGAVCRDSQQEEQREGEQNEDYLDDVAVALRDIGDQLAQDYELNRLIDMVPIQSPREIFMKVCKQMFEDGQFNWGRVVALFYFAYRLITKAVVTAVEKNIPWIKEIFHWVIDFFYQYVAGWIIQRGGWRMIREYWGTSSTTITALGLTAVITVLYVWWKQQ